MCCRLLILCMVLFFCVCVWFGWMVVLCSRNGLMISVLSGDV